MKLFGLAVRMMKYLNFYKVSIGVNLLLLPIMLCLTPLFCLGGLVLNRWLGLTHLVWLVRPMVLKLEIALLNWWTDTLWDKRGLKFSMRLVNDAKTLALSICMRMVNIVLMTWN